VCRIVRLDDAVAVAADHMGAAKKGLSALLHKLFATAGDIRVSDTELHVIPAPLSSPHRSQGRPSFSQNSATCDDHHINSRLSDPLFIHGDGPELSLHGSFAWNAALYSIFCWELGSLSFPP